MPQKISVHNTIIAPGIAAELARVCDAVLSEARARDYSEDTDDWAGSRYEAAGDLARKHDAYVQTHLAEMKPELDAVAKLHGGPDYTSVYHKAGLLSPRTLLGHCVYLSDDERRRQP